MGTDTDDFSGLRNKYLFFEGWNAVVVSCVGETRAQIMSWLPTEVWLGLAAGEIGLYKELLATCVIK